MFPKLVTEIILPHLMASSGLDTLNRFFKKMGLSRLQFVQGVNAFSAAVAECLILDNI